MRIDTQRKHQQLLRESTKSNEEVGKEIAVELTGVAQQPEIDKVKLFTEEVDKITSLIIGLSSRLAKASAACAKNAQPDEKSQVQKVLIKCLMYSRQNSFNFLSENGHWTTGYIGRTA